MIFFLLFTANCDGRGMNDFSVPWLPKVAPFAAPPAEPNLTPVVRRRQSIVLSGLDKELLHAQVKINAKVMAEIDELKKEKERWLAMQDKMAKENQFLAVKYAQANDQLTYLKKKIEKRNDASKENENPNENGGSGGQKMDKRSSLDKTNEQNNGQ